MKRELHESACRPLRGPSYSAPLCPHPPSLRPPRVENLNENPTSREFLGDTVPGSSFRTANWGDPRRFTFAPFGSAPVSAKGRTQKAGLTKTDGEVAGSAFKHHRPPVGWPAGIRERSGERLCSDRRLRRPTVLTLCPFAHVMCYTTIVANEKIGSRNIYKISPCRTVSIARII